MANDKIRKLPVTSEDAQAQAREQATEYESLFGNKPLELDGGEIVMIPPHPDYGLLDDDRMEAWDALRYEVETEYDREPDIFIPEQNLDGGITLPAETRKGAILVPYRKTHVNEDGETVTELVKPSHSVRVVQTALGQELYDKIIAGGRQAADVWRIWGQQSLLINERRNRDSKSARGAVDLAPVPPADS